MPDRIYTVLFLSQRDSARAMLAAALLNQIGRGKFRASSAGIRPAQAYDPTALELLEHAHIPLPAGAPQHYRAFCSPDAPPLDFVFTLSDTAAGEPTPSWQGLPVTAHWSSADPERLSDEAGERRRSLIATRSQLERRLRVFTNLPFDSLDRMSLQSHVDEIGRASDTNDAGDTRDQEVDAERIDPRRTGVPAQTPPPPD